jgi:D-glycero-alpha-D-manno-heptose-7-phosphate kinase
VQATSQQYLIAKKMLKALIKEDISKTSKLVTEAWQSKKNFSQMISNRHIDSIILEFLNSGAKGLKLTGAGGGGHLLVIGSKYMNNRLMQKSKSLGLDPGQFSIVRKGCQVWK